MLGFPYQYYDSSSDDNVTLMREVGTTFIIYLFACHSIS